jgi:PAS domain S-box-containing protein
MESEEKRKLESRVLLLAPTPRDAQITCDFLRDAGLDAVPCQSIGAICAQVGLGCGALLLTEEVIIWPHVGQLIGLLELQPPWSDLPLVLLMRGGAQSLESSSILRLLGNVTLLERPTLRRTVVSAVEAAVRARKRQYLAREHIEETRRAENKHRALQQQLELAVEASELGTFHCEMPLGRILWNRRCKEHFFLPPDAEINFELFYSILHPDDRERTRLAVEASVHRGAPYDIEYRTVSPHGEIRWIRATGRTFLGPGGEPLRFDGTTQDITERKRAAEEREELYKSEQAARTESERAGRMKDDFLATLSHELRTPLNAILGWSQLIRRGQDKETLAEGLEVIERNARVQVQLIDDLLDMSRVISGKLRLELKPIDPIVPTEAAIETVAPTAAAKGVRIIRALDPKAGPVAGDTGRLQQVVWNLLCNAVKFTEAGGQIEVIQRRADGRVEIVIADTGKGIEGDFLPHIFERFRQADASTTRKHGGLGLGLAIVKQLVELHGGTISAASDGTDRGSTFTISLPALTTTAEGSRDSGGAQTASWSRQPASAELTGVTVLVVDDEKDGRGVVKRLLEEYGAVVTAAGSAAEAIALLPVIKPSVLVSDISMPEVDGYELLRKVRALGRNNGGDVPAIALSALARSEDRNRALRAGYLVHIAKPVEPQELIATVATVGGVRNQS